MNPVNDIVCNLLETPFSRWKDEDKKAALSFGRPTDIFDISVKKDVKKTGKSYNVKFKSCWFSEFPWLCSSRNLQRLFCWPCLLFSNKNNVWNKAGFNDFINTTRSLHKHNDSAEHLKCTLQLNIFHKNRNTIAGANQENSRLFQAKFNENVRLNRLLFELLIDATLYLSNKELAFRDHDESKSSLNRGNYKELLSVLISRSSLEIQNHYDKIKGIFSCDSKATQNELIECISDYLQEHVRIEINGSDFFSVQVDDTTDICQISQCSIIVRYVNVDGKVVERILGFHEVSPDRSAEVLFNLLDSVLIEYNYERKLIAQCYDGANVMSGHLNGLQQRVKDKAPQAISVHCLAHRLNLLLKQSCNNISKCRVFFANVSGIPSFFHNSAERTHILDSVFGRRIPTLVETRWNSNSRLLHVILQDWGKLKRVFEIIINDKESDDKTIRSCRGFINEMNNFEFAFLIVVFNEIFNLTDILFEVLQKKSLDISYCVTKIKDTSGIIRQKRDGQYFKTLFDNATELAPVTVGRGQSEQDVVDGYRALYFEIIDNILMQISVRFHDCEKLQFLCLVDPTRFKDHATNFPSDALNQLHQCYPRIFNKLQRIKNELTLFYAEHENYKQCTLDDILLSLKENRVVFEETYKLFSLVVTFSTTSSSVERSFSSLERIKPDSSNTISQSRISSLANISNQKEFLAQLMKNHPFYEDITDKFAALKDRSIDLIYKKIAKRDDVFGETVPVFMQLWDRSSMLVAIIQEVSPQKRHHASLLVVILAVFKRLTHALSAMNEFLDVKT